MVSYAGYSSWELLAKCGPEDLIYHRARTASSRTLPNGPSGEGPGTERGLLPGGRSRADETDLGWIEWD